MAVTAITPTVLALNTFSADILDGDGVVADTPADGWEITLGTGITPERLILKFLVNGSGDTITVTTGDQPPAALAGLAALSQVMAASDVRYVVLEGARVLQDDGKIIVTCTDAGSTCKAFTMPHGGGGGY